MAPWIIYERVLRKGTREQHDWKACRSTATSCVAIIEKEFQEHCSEYDETVGAEEFEKLLRETPSAVAFNRGNLQPSNLVHSKEYQAWERGIWASCASSLQILSVRQLQRIIEKAAEDIWKCRFPDSLTGHMTCSPCVDKQFNALQQWIIHCVGKARKAYVTCRFLGTAFEIDSQSFLFK